MVNEVFTFTPVRVQGGPLSFVLGNGFRAVTEESTLTYPFYQTMRVKGRQGVERDGAAGNVVGSQSY